MDTTGKEFLNIEESIVISREWLNQNLQPDRARFIIKNYQPLKTVLEVAWEDGFELGLKKPESRESGKSEFLKNPIKM